MKKLMFFLSLIITCQPFLNSAADNLNQRIYCDGLPRVGIGSVTSEQFWAKGASGRMDMIEVNVFSNYSKRVYIQVFRQNGYSHAILGEIGAAHTFMMLESNPPVRIECRAAREDDKAENKLLGRQSNEHCAKIGGITADDLVSVRTFASRASLRNQIRRDMQISRRTKDECGEVSRAYRERANRLKIKLREYTSASAQNAANIGGLNHAVLGITSVALPALGAAKSNIEARQRTPYVPGSPPPTARAGSKKKGNERRRPPSTHRCDAPGATSCQ